MFKSILVPIDLADTDLAKPALATAITLSQTWSGSIRLLNVLPMTPVMLAEYVPADFDVQQRQVAGRRAQRVECGHPVRSRHDGHRRRRQVAACELAQRRIVIDDKNADRLLEDVGPAGVSNLGHA